jgi:leader peptidase (prepilin peptidase) / N-methyltransferase
VDVALGLLAFWPALALGSFVNVVAARVPLRRSVVRPASACMSCGTELAWYDNVPVLSWLLLRGRCRSCSAKISPLYPAVELATAGLVAACFLAFGLSGEAFVSAFFCVVLVAVTATDLTHRIVPNRIVLPAAGIVLAAQTMLEPSPEWALGALGASGFLFVAALAYPAGMGMGDVKLALLLGAMLGRLVGVGLMLGMLAALLPSVVLLAKHGPAARKMGIPFAPFLALGALIALFAGEALLDAYLSTF